MASQVLRYVFILFCSTKAIQCMSESERELFQEIKELVMQNRDILRFLTDSRSSTSFAAQTKKNITRLSSDFQNLKDMFTEHKNQQEETIAEIKMSLGERVKCLSVFNETTKEEEELYDSDLECPEKSTKLEKGCFLVNLQHQDWILAREFCQTHKGDLAESEDTTGLYLLYETERSKAKGEAGYPWVGATGRGRKGGWLWVSGKELSLQDLRWDVGYPKGAGNGLWCARLVPGGFLRDDPFWLKGPSVCKIPAM